MEPGPPDNKRQRLASWSTSSPHPVSLPRPHNTTSPLPPPRASSHHPPYPGSYQPYHPRTTEPHSSAPPTPIHPAGPTTPHPESDRRHHEQESYAPMQDHYQHHSHPSASPAHGPYQPYPPRDPTTVKREVGVEDPHRPSSTGHVSELPPPHHTLPPPQSYPDTQPRHMSYDNGTSVPPTPGSYRPSAYPPPPPTPLSAQTSYEQHGGYPSEPFYSVSYSSSMPSSKQKKNTRASQACDQCRQLKAKCDENKPCKTCKDKGLDCKYRETAPKAPDKTTAEILEGIMNLTSRFDGFDGLQNNFQQLSRTLNDRMTRLETVITQNGSLAQPQVVPQEIKTRPASPVLNGGASGPYYPQGTPHDLSAPQEQAPMMQMMEDDPEAEPGPPVPPGEPAIPMNHTTLAGLLLEWPSIREMTKHLVEREGIRYVSEYPIAQEQKRGPLIVYGRGEDSHHSRYSREPTDHGNLDMADDSSDIASPSPAADFGQVGGLSPSDMVEYKGGVLAADGNPDFTEAKVWSYVESFKNNILNMHPIIQPETIANWVRQFLDELPTTQPRSTKPQVAKPAFAIPTNPQTPVDGTGEKRKRGIEPEDSESQTSAPAKAGKPTRSIHSALVLAVLALGKICQCRSHIPDVVHPSTDPAYSASPHIKNGAPPSPGGHSSPPSHSSHSHSAQPSPRDQFERGNQSRRGSLHGTSGHRPGFSLKKNYEVIPGLEYFAYATDILGNLAGSYNNIKDVYASIFAGLYYGQLNRPLESYQYIHRASHKLQVIMRPSLDKLRNMKMRREFIQDPKHNQLALAFWTCLQLESDLIAELPLPPSGLLNYEEDMPHPNMSLLRGFDQRVLDSYPGQLYLRTHLNSIHRMFYAPDDPTKNRAGQEKFKNVDLVADAVSGMTWVAPSFAFKEEDPPAGDILAARLRAKYWGAQMITYRPFIRQILQFTHSIHQHPSSPNPPTWSEFRQDIIAPAIRPGAKSIREIEPRVVELARKGIKALLESTRAFHNLGEDRPIITNIFGTAHAQWGNLLVLSAAYKDPVLHRHVDADLLQDLLQKTIRFFKQSATATSSLKTDLHILEGLQRDLFLPDPRTGSSFSSQSMHTPRITTTSVPADNRSTSDSTMGTPQIPTSAGPR